VNRDDLDAFFALCDDVLNNWHGSDDAMHARVPTDDDAEALPGDSYYEQWDFSDADSPSSASIMWTWVDRIPTPIILDSTIILVPIDGRATR
jgi:hypothetical protein